MNIHFPSVLKSGGIAAVVAVVLGILSLIPFVGPFVGLCYCLGGFLIPVAAGLGYGYLAPGDEDYGESAVGGALSGGAAGILYGLLFGFGTLIITAISGGGIGEAVASGVLTTIFSACGFTFAGIIFGALGGVLWPLIQGQRSK